MRVKNFFSRVQQIFAAVGRWFKKAFQFRRGNLLDQIARAALFLLCIGLVGGWVVTNYFLPKTVEDGSQAAQTIGRDELAAVVKQELQFLMETEYSWLLDLPKTQLALGPQVEPDPAPKPDPQQLRPDEAVEVLAVSFDRILWPLKGEVAAEYGWYRHPVYQDWRFNSGLELAAAASEQVRSVLPGRVESISPSDDGFEVVVTHGSGWQTVYRGIRSVAVKIGDMVDQNQMLAQAGEDGRIFFALFYENEPVNPMQYMSLY